jgi:hypothetical protein
VILRARALLFVWCLALAPSPAHAAHLASPDDVVRVAPVSVAGAPRSLVTIAVAPPAEVREALALRYDVKITGAVGVLGRLEGVVERDADGRFRPLLLTLRVPSDALVGLLDAADVEFTTDDGRVVVVPVVVRVPAVRQVEMRGTKELRDLDRGDRLELVYQVHNLGNAPESFAATVRVPTGWMGRARTPDSVVVAAHSSAEVSVGLRVPPLVNAGSFAVTIELRRRDSGDSTAVVTSRTNLRIRELERRDPGVRLQPFIALTSTGNGQGIGTGMVLGGPLSEGLHLRAQYTPVAPSGGPEMFGLASVGAMRMPFQASLTADQWNVDVGNALISFSELTGVNVAGQGVSATAHTSDRQVTAVVARPAVGTGASGHVVGAGAWIDRAEGRFGASVSYLSEARASTLASRELTAIGGDWTSRPIRGAVLSAGLAVRDYSAGLSLGYRAQLLRETDLDRVRLSFVHTPGGTRAFALATDQAQFEGRRVLTERVSASVSGTAARDRSGFFDDLSSSAVTAGPRIRLTDLSTLGLEVSTQRTSARTSGGSPGGFGSSRQSLGAMYQTELGAWNLLADASLSALSRDTRLFSGGTDSRTAVQRELSVSASRSLHEYGQLMAGATVAQTGAGVGQPSSATSAYTRWAGIPLVIRGQVFRAEQELRLIQTSFDGARLGLRTGFTTSLRSGFDLVGSAERNPFIRDSRGREGWIFALKITASTELLSSSSLETPGVVFEDANANGRQDADERGIAGVVLLHDNRRFVSGREGKYRMPASLRGRVRVDASSLPAGLIAHPRFALDSLEQRDLPLLPTGTRTIALQMAADGDGRSPSGDLSRADVWLVDTFGLEWVGRAQADGRFAFEHVPVGEYVLRLDFGRLPEPLRAEEIAVQITPGVNADVVVPVRGRTVRIITPPGTGGRGGVAPRSGPSVGPRSGPRAGR